MEGENTVTAQVPPILTNGVAMSLYLQSLPSVYTSPSCDSKIDIKFPLDLLFRFRKQTS
jgi:hypothetical protein